MRYLGGRCFWCAILARAPLEAGRAGPRSNLMITAGWAVSLRGWELAPLLKSKDYWCKGAAGSVRGSTLIEPSALHQSKQKNNLCAATIPPFVPALFFALVSRTVVRTSALIHAYPLAILKKSSVRFLTPRQSKTDPDSADLQL